MVCELYLNIPFCKIHSNVKKFRNYTKRCLKKKEIIIISPTSNNRCQHWSIFSLSILCMDFFHLVLTMTLYTIFFSEAFLMPLKTLVNVMIIKSLSHVWLFWGPMDCSLPGSSGQGICQARIMEWVAISISKYKSYIQFHKYTTIYLITKYPCY